MRLATILLVIAAFISAATPAAAQSAATPGEGARPAGPSALTRADVDAWLDGLVPTMMRAGNIPGGVVVIVKDGQILTERGFGYSDVARKQPVDPRRSMFRPGSISKVFTWTAVMQLVEQGKIDLDADVNRYLDFKIPSRDGKPITMRNIMTHTPGFEEMLKNIMGSRPNPPLDAYLKTWVPHRIFAPGTVPAYSNYASTLAGYIVQRVSREPFDDYMDRHILKPLGMRLSTFRQPVPASLRPLLVKGYLPESDEAQYFEYVGPAPAGSLSATGHDMANFMIAHLQNGRFGNARILAPGTAVQMHAIQRKIYPALKGMALGLYEHSRNGRRVLAHNGGTQFFHSDMHLFLDDGIGLFISLNSAGKDGAASNLHEALFHGFADRYFPADSAASPAGVDRKTTGKHARLMAGHWESSRRSDSSALRLLGLLGTVAISANDDGTINFPGPTGKDVSWREIAPFVWRSADDPDKIQAILVDGKPALLGMDLAAPVAFQPVPAWRSPSWVVPALAAALAILLVTGLSWPVAAFVRRRFGTRLAYSGRAALSYRATRALSLAAFILFIAIPATFTYMSGDLNRFSDSTDAWLLFLKIAAMIVFVAALLAALYDLLKFWSVKDGRFARTWSILVAASCAMILWTAIVFRIASFGSHY